MAIQTEKVEIRDGRLGSYFIVFTTKEYEIWETVKSKRLDKAVS